MKRRNQIKKNIKIEENGKERKKQNKETEKERIWRNKEEKEKGRKNK